MVGDIHIHPDFKLGASVGSNTWDKRTVNLADFINLDIQIPQSWDFDHNRSPFKSHLWGNDQYGDCELAARANLLLRLERKETKSTPSLADQDIIDLYKSMKGCNSPGDSNDTGMTTLDNLKQWRSGWNITKKWSGSTITSRNYTISAYGYINSKNNNLLRLAPYLFSGIIIGASLPITAQEQVKTGVWDIVPDAGEAGEPGSWGGHAILCKRFDADNLYVITWGREIRATNAWIEKYVQEAYAVVDSLDSWVKFRDVLDVQKMIQEMEQSGIKVAM